MKYWLHSMISVILSEDNNRVVKTYYHPLSIVNCHFVIFCHFITVILRLFFTVFHYFTDSVLEFVFSPYEQRR